MQERFIVAADPGSGKISLSVSSVTDGYAKVLFYGEEPSDGISDGGIFNPVKASAPLRKLITQAEESLGIVIGKVIVPLPRYRINLTNGQQKVERSDAESYITDEEIASLCDFALEKYLPDMEEGQEIYCMLPQSFSTEELFQAGQDDVIGSSSKELSGEFKILSGPVKSAANAAKMISACGKTIAARYFVPAAMGGVMLTEDEMENGAALIEIGAGVTSVSIFNRGVMRYYASIPFGGKTLTEDIRLETGFNESLCENIKLAYGFAMPDRLQSMSDKVLQVNDERSGESNQVSIKYLCEIINSRMTEIVKAILFKIGQSGYADRLRGGLVLCGGGSELALCAALVKEMSGYNVRIGYVRSRNIDACGCPDMDDASAASHFAMISLACDDEYINCVKVNGPEPETQMESDKPKPAEGDIFSPEEFGDAVKPEKQPRKPRQPKAKTINPNSLVGRLFQGINNNFEKLGEEEN